MLSLFARIESALHDERGQWYTGSGGLLGLIVALAIIIACIVFVWVNVDVNEK